MHIVGATRGRLSLSARGAADVLWAWGTARRRPRNAACAAVRAREADPDPHVPAAGKG